MQLGLSDLGQYRSFLADHPDDPNRDPRYAHLPADILPDPHRVGTSLYEELRANDRAPVRAVQRVTACNLTAPDAELLGLKVGDAVLSIERTAFLPHGRIVELTTGLYRSDMYDFVTELKLEVDE